MVHAGTSVPGVNTGIVRHVSAASRARPIRARSRRYFDGLRPGTLSIVGPTSSLRRLTAELISPAQANRKAWPAALVPAGTAFRGRPGTRRLSQYRPRQVDAGPTRPRRLRVDTVSNGATCPGALSRASAAASRRVRLTDAQICLDRRACRPGSPCPGRRQPASPMRVPHSTNSSERMFGFVDSAKPVSAPTVAKRTPEPSPVVCPRGDGGAGEPGIRGTSKLVVRACQLEDRPPRRPLYRDLLQHRVLGARLGSLGVAAGQRRGIDLEDPRRRAVLGARPVR